MPIPRSLLRRDAPTDLDLTVLSGTWPAAISGEMFLSAPHPDGFDAPHPFFSTGVTYRLSLEPGRHGAAPDSFAWRTARVDTPSARLMAKRPDLFTASMIGTASPFGYVNAANTAPLPWGDRLFHTWDAGRPVEIDPRTMGFLGEVGHRSQWQEMMPYPVLPMVMSTAHPVIDPERDVLWSVNTAWGMLNVVRWDGEGPVQQWPIVDAAIPQSVHTITQTRDWLVVADCAFKVEPQVMAGGRRTEPANASGPVYLIRKADLEATPPGTPVTGQRHEVAPENNHYYASWDDSDGIAVLFEHTQDADIAITQRPGDVDALGRPCDPALAGLYGFPMSPDRTTMVVFDPERGAQVHLAEMYEPGLLWTRQLNAMDWSTEGRTRPTVHHTVHQGFRPEGITQEMLALYSDRVDRSLMPSDETSPLVVTCSMPDLDVVSVHELAMDDFPTSPIFVPRDPGADPAKSAHSGTDPGGHDGFVVVPVLNDAGFRVEVFDAADVGAGPLAVIGAPGATVPFVLHSAWMPVADEAPDVERLRFADELDRLDELEPELRSVVLEVADELAGGVPMS